MSYEIEIYEKDGRLIYESNMTFNVQPMFVKCFNTLDGINYLDGKEGLDCYDLAMAAITDIQLNYSSYKELDPPNGWGCVNDVIALLTTMLAFYICKPECITRIMK